MLWWVLSMQPDMGWFEAKKTGKERPPRGLFSAVDQKRDNEGTNQGSHREKEKEGTDVIDDV